MRAAAGITQTTRLISPRARVRERTIFKKFDLITVETLPDNQEFSSVCSPGLNQSFRVLKTPGFVDICRNMSFEAFFAEKSPRRPFASHRFRDFSLLSSLEMT
jgi:hypothetical protein